MNQKLEIEELSTRLSDNYDKVFDELKDSYTLLEKHFLNWMLGLQTIKQSIPIQSFKGVHKEQRAFIICNGPSLNKIDLSLLKNEITFGCNRIYIGLEKWDLTLDYWAVQDETQIIQQYSEYPSALSKNTVKFIPLQFASLFDNSAFENVCYPYLEFFYDNYPKFNMKNPWFYSGMTVSYWLMQLAFYMGCKTVYIVGMDHSYKITDREIKGNNRWQDPNSQSHFHPDYMNAKNDQLWNLPDVDKMEMAYGRAKESYDLDNKIICNATPGTMCDVFPKVKYEDLFD